MLVGDEVALTATIDILKDIAAGGGPQRSLLALGYAGWGAGQLDAEIQANGWLSAPADDALVFDADLDGKWERAIGKTRRRAVEHAALRRSRSRLSRRVVHVSAARRPIRSSRQQRE